MKRAFILIIIFFATAIPSFAAEPKILNYDLKNKTVEVEIEGKEYTLDLPIEDVEPSVETLHATSQEKEKDPALSGSVKKKKEYAKGPPVTTVGSRLYNIPTDNLLKKKGFCFDFTHRFANPIDSTTSEDVYGLDGFAYTGIGLYYGLTNKLEAHAFRSSLTDASELGLKYQVFKEAKHFGDGAPFGLTVSSGFQTDNIQNSIDPYVQGIFSKVVIPGWLKVYLVPSYSNKSATIASGNSKSASFFTFTDPKHRGYKRTAGTFALPIGASLKILPNGRLSVFGEYTPVLSGYKEVKNGWAFGLQILSRLETHVWTIGVSNVPYSTFGQYIVGGPSNNFHFGFDIAARIK